MATQTESLIVELDAKTDKYLRKMGSVDRKNKKVIKSLKLLDKSLAKFNLSLSQVDAQLCLHAKKLDLANRKSRKNIKSTKQLTSGNKQLRRSVIGLDKSVGTFTRKLRNADIRITKTTKSTQRLTTTNRGFNLSLVAGAVALALATSRVISYADSFTEMTNKLKLATDGQEDLVKTTKAMFDIAEETRTSVVATTSLFTKMERATRNLDFSQERLLKVTGSINKAFAISGATAQETTGSIRQLGQALASGTLRGDEFNSIAEQAPIIMEAVKEATGKTAGELRELAATGALTAKILIESLERYADKIDTDFAQSTATFSQKLEIASNNAIEFVGANLAINNAVGLAGDAIVGLSNNIDTLAVIAKIAAIVVVGRLVGGLKLMQVESIKTGFTFNAMGQVMSKTTAATVAMTRASRVARGALAALGGPVGILITAAASLALFVDFESETEKQLAKTTQKIDDQISSLKSLNKIQIESASQKFIKQSKEIAEEIQTQIDRIKQLQKDQFDAAQSTARFGTGFFELGGKIKGAKDELEELFKQQEQIQRLGAKIFEVQLKTTIDERKDEKGLIDIEGQAQIKRDKAAEKRRLDAEAKSRKRQLDAITQRQADFNAESETEIDALQKRLDLESELINESEESKLISKMEAMERRTELENEFRERLVDLAQTDIERIQEQTELELELQQDLLERKLINEEEFQLQVNGITNKGIEDRIKIAQKEAIAKAGLDSLVLKNGISALETFGQKSEKAARAAFNIKKLQKGSEAFVNAAAGVTEALPNIPLAIAVGALGAAQIAAIAGTSFGGTGGGGGISAPSVAETTTTEELEISTLEVSEAGTEGTGVTTISFATGTGDQLADAFAEVLNENMRQGRSPG